VIAARSLGEAGRGQHRSAEHAVGGQQAAARAAAGVVVCVQAEGGVVQDVDLVWIPRERLDADVHQHRGAVRVGRVGLGDPVVAGLGGVDLAVDRAAGGEQLHLVLGVLILAVDERLAVRDHQLGVTGRGRVDPRKEHLREGAVVDRVPGLAPQGARRAEPILVPRRPVSGLARGTGRVCRAGLSRRCREGTDDEREEQQTGGAMQAHFSSPLVQ
jgi:hypothetical protein